MDSPFSVCLPCIVSRGEDVYARHEGGTPRPCQSTSMRPSLTVRPSSPASSRSSCVPTNSRRQPVETRDMGRLTTKVCRSSREAMSWTATPLFSETRRTSAYMRSRTHSISADGREWRSAWGSSLHHPEAKGDTGQRMFDTQFLLTGVPAMLLKNRPDIRLADYAMEEAFYNTQVARSAFFPSITLSGAAGWTNNVGAVIDPGKLLLNAVVSLTQPIFARGRLTANLKIAKLSQKDLQQKYVQTVINAGNQVNEALADCQAAREKHAYFHRQVEVLHEAYKGTHELMDNGKANYLEVLTAQETLLNSQLSEAANMYNGAKAVIALYIALGGGTK